MAYKELTNAGITIFNPDKSKTFHQWKISYVDDNRLLIQLEQPDFHQIQGIEKIKHSLDTWSKLVDIQVVKFLYPSKAGFKL